MKTIRGKLTAIVLLIVFVCVLITAGIVIYLADQNVISSEKAEIQLESNYYAESINNWFKLEEAYIENSASSLLAADAFNEPAKLKNILVQHYSKNSDLLDLYIGFEDKSCYNANEEPLPDGYDPTSRDWYKQAVSEGTTIITDPYLDVQFETMCTTIATPIYKNNELIGVLALDITLDTITNLVNTIEYKDGVYGFLLDSSACYVTHPNTAFAPTEDYNIALSDVEPELSALFSSAGDTIVISKDYTDTKTYFSSAKIDDCNWVLCLALPASQVLKSVLKMLDASIQVIIISLIVVSILMFFIINIFVKPIKNMIDNVIAISKGDLNIEIQKSTKKDEIATLTNTLADLVEMLKNIIGDTNYILDQIASGNLKVDKMKHYPGSFDELSKSVNAINKQMNELIKGVQTAVSEVESGSSQLSMAADNLANGTTQQAASVSTLATEVNDISDQITRNSEQCKIVDEKLTELEGKVANGNDEMQQLHDVVIKIEEMSTGIQTIMEAIDSIAFQTNILSLNASVEAARVGEQGAGFAVVAGEVRTLATKCAEESKRTGELVTECINAINGAKLHADKTTEYLNQVVESSEDIANAFRSISNDTVLQAESSAKIKDEMNSISEVVETNSATAEETAASTDVLSEQARRLNVLVNKFQTK